MAETKCEYGVVGLGQIGGNLARQALERACRVLGLLHRDPHNDIAQMGPEPIRSGAAFKALPPLRVVSQYVPAGPAVDNWLDGLAGVLEVGEVLVNGGIAQAVMQPLTSREAKKHSATAVAMMRHGFGGHVHPGATGGWSLHETRSQRDQVRHTSGRERPLTL